MEEETLPKEIQERLTIQLLGVECPEFGYKDGKYQVVGTFYEYEGKRYYFEEDKSRACASCMKQFYKNSIGKAWHTSVADSMCIAAGHIKDE